MQVKIFFKDYEYKMSLGAIKRYGNETGRDLWSDILGYSSLWQETEGMKVVKRIHKLTEFMPFEVSAKLFHCVIRAADSSISLSEIEDAMFHVGVVPTERDDQMSEPWPIALMTMVQAIHLEMMDFTRKKKPADTELL